jgi:hypothetical protein
MHTENPLKGWLGVMPCLVSWKAREVATSEAEGKARFVTACKLSLTTR